MLNASLSQVWGQKRYPPIKSWVRKPLKLGTPRTGSNRNCMQLFVWPITLNYHPQKDTDNKHTKHHRTLSMWTLCCVSRPLYEIYDDWPNARSVWEFRTDSASRFRRVEPTITGCHLTPAMNSKFIILWTSLNNRIDTSGRKILYSTKWRRRQQT